MTDRILIRFASGEDQIEARRDHRGRARPPVRRRPEPRARDPGLARRPGRVADVPGPGSPRRRAFPDGGGPRRRGSSGGTALRRRSPGPAERGEDPPARGHGALERRSDRPFQRRRAPRPGLRAGAPADARAGRGIGPERRGSGARREARGAGEGRGRALRGAAERHHAAQPRERARRRRAGHPAPGRKPDRSPVAGGPGHDARKGDPRRHRDAGVPHGPRRFRIGAGHRAHPGDGEALPGTRRLAHSPPAQPHAHGGVHHGRGVGHRPAERFAGGLHHPRRQGRAALLEPHPGQDRPTHGRRLHRAQVVHRAGRRRARAPEGESWRR